MFRLGAESILAVGAVWLLIMLPTAAFGGVGAQDTAFGRASGVPAAAEAASGIAVSSIL